MWLTLAFQTLHAEPLHPQKREAKVSQHHLKQRRPRKPNFPCARWIRKGLNWLFPSYSALSVGYFDEIFLETQHINGIYVFCTNLCLLPFDAAGSKCLVQLGPSWQSQRTAKQDQQRNIYAQLRWTRHMLTWFYWDGEIFLSFRFAALQTKAGNAISLHALSPRSRVQTFAASPPVNEMKGNYLGIFLLTHVGFRLGSVGLIDSMKPRQGTTYSVRNKKKCVKLKGNHEGKTHQEAKHGKVKGQKTKCKN